MSSPTLAASSAIAGHRRRRRAARWQGPAGGELGQLVVCDAGRPRTPRTAPWVARRARARPATNGWPAGRDWWRAVRRPARSARSHPRAGREPLGVVDHQADRRGRGATRRRPRSQDRSTSSAAPMIAPGPTAPSRPTAASTSRARATPSASACSRPIRRPRRGEAGGSRLLPAPAASSCRCGPPTTEATLCSQRPSRGDQQPRSRERTRSQLWWLEPERAGHASRHHKSAAPVWLAIAASSLRLSGRVRHPVSPQRAQGPQTRAIAGPRASALRVGPMRPAALTRPVVDSVAHGSDTDGERYRRPDWVRRVRDGLRLGWTPSPGSHRGRRPDRAGAGVDGHRRSG